MTLELAEDAIFSLLSTDRAHRQAIESVLSELGLHRSQHIALIYLSHLEEPPTQVELARNFHISPAAVTVTLRKLEKSGFIERRVCEGNARANRIYLTESGREVLKLSADRFREVDAAMIENIPQEDLDTMIRCTRLMKDNLTKHFGSGTEPGKDSEEE